jgi:hypothetical protein
MIPGRVLILEDAIGYQGIVIGLYCGCRSNPTLIEWLQLNDLWDESETALLVHKPVLFGSYGVPLLR